MRATPTPKPPIWVKERYHPLTPRGCFCSPKQPTAVLPAPNTASPPPMDSVLVRIRRHRLSRNEMNLWAFPCPTHTRVPSSPAGRAACWRWPRRCAGSSGDAAALRARRWHWHPAGTHSSLQTESKGHSAAGRGRHSVFTPFYSTHGLPSPNAALPHVRASQTQEQPTQKKVALKTKQVSEEKLLTLHSDIPLTKPRPQSAQKTVKRW